MHPDDYLLQETEYFEQVYNELQQSQESFIKSFLAFQKLDDREAKSILVNLIQKCLIKKELEIKEDLKTSKNPSYESCIKPEDLPF